MRSKAIVRHVVSLLTLIAIIAIFSGCSSDKGTESNGNLPPSTPSNPSPADNASDRSLDITLSWQCTDPDNDPLTFDTYFGTGASPVLVSSGQTQTTYNPGQLQNASTYYWKVDAKDNKGHKSTGPLWSFSTVRQQSHLSLIGSYPVPSAEGVFVSGGYAYVTGDSSLYRINVSTPSSPGPVDIIMGPSTGEGVVVSGNHAYVADYRHGLFVINLTDFTDTARYVGVNGDGKCWNVAILDTIAYVANEDSGLVIINIKNPENPVFVDRLQMGPRDISIAGNNLYVLDRMAGLMRKFDVPDPASPQPLCISPIPTGIHHSLSLFATGNLVCVTDDIWDQWEANGLTTYDASTCSPRGTLATPGYATDVFISGDYAYIADYGHGVRVIDVQNLMVPQIVDSLDIPLESHSVYVADSLIYVTGHHSGADGLFILQFAP